MRSHFLEHTNLIITSRGVIMGVFRKLGLALTLPILFFAFRAAYNQYLLVSLTYTVDPISPDDFVFDSELYRTLFNHTKWAKVDTFAVGVGVPFAVLPKNLRDEESFGAEVMKQLWDQRRTPSPHTRTMIRDKTNRACSGHAVQQTAGEQGAEDGGRHRQRRRGGAGRQRGREGHVGGARQPAEAEPAADGLRAHPRHLRPREQGRHRHDPVHLAHAHRDAAQLAQVPRPLVPDQRPAPVAAARGERHRRPAEHSARKAGAVRNGEIALGLGGLGRAVLMCTFLRLIDFTLTGCLEWAGMRTRCCTKLKSSDLFYYLPSSEMANRNLNLGKQE